MRTTGVFDTHSRTIITPVGQPIELVFFGDVHFKAPLHCRQTWEEFLDKYRDRKDCYFVGMGDYLDLISTSERSGMAAANLHESTAETLQDLYRSSIDQFADQINFMRGRLLCLLEGNHHVVFKDGTTTAQRIAQQLNRGLPEELQAAYLGDAGLFRLQCRRHSSGAALSLVLALHHGAGGGGTLGAGINSVDKMSLAMEADIYAMGDNHQLTAANSSKLYMNSKGTICHRHIVLLRTGSFLRGYVQKKASYIADKMLRPANLGAASVTLTYQRRQIDNVETAHLALKATV